MNIGCLQTLVNQTTQHIGVIVLISSRSAPTLRIFFDHEHTSTSQLVRARYANQLAQCSVESSTWTINNSKIPILNPSNIAPSFSSTQRIASRSLQKFTTHQLMIRKLDACRAIKSQRLSHANINNQTDRVPLQTDQDQTVDNRVRIDRKRTHRNRFEGSSAQFDACSMHFFTRCGSKLSPYRTVFICDDANNQLFEFIVRPRFALDRSSKSDLRRFNDKRNQRHRAPHMCKRIGHRDRTDERRAVRRDPSPSPRRRDL